MPKRDSLAAQRIVYLDADPPRAKTSAWRARGDLLPGVTACHPALARGNAVIEMADLHPHRFPRCLKTQPTTDTQTDRRVAGKGDCGFHAFDQLGGKQRPFAIEAGMTFFLFGIAGKGGTNKAAAPNGQQIAALAAHNTGITADRIVGAAQFQHSADFQRAWVGKAHPPFHFAHILYRHRRGDEPRPHFHCVRPTANAAGLQIGLSYAAFASVLARQAAKNAIERKTTCGGDIVAARFTLLCLCPRRLQCFIPRDAHHPAAPPAIGEKGAHSERQAGTCPAGSAGLARQRQIAAKTSLERRHTVDRSRPVARPARCKADEHCNVHWRQGGSFLRQHRIDKNPGKAINYGQGSLHLQPFIGNNKLFHRDVGALGI